MPGEGRTAGVSGSVMVAALAALLVMPAAGPAAAEPLLSAPEPQESAAPLPSPAPSKPQTDAFDCWLLDPGRLEQASDRGLCGDAFARAPETASLPEAPPPPLLTPARKPKVPERRIRSSSSRSSNGGGMESHSLASSRARVSRGGDGDFFSNFQRDFRSLTNLLGGGGPSPRRGDDSPASHTSHNH